jgi:hypothetical protein
LEEHDSRQEKREERQRRRRERMLQHGRGFVKSYRDAILKRAKQVRKKGDG